VRGEDGVSGQASQAGQVLLRDLVVIPDVVHDGDFVLALSKGVGQKSTITDYVVTDSLAANFDKALALIKSAVETGSSRAAYLDGSFGSGKSHFMAVLYAILDGDPDARGKRGLADIVAKHDPWLAGRRFLLVPYHLPDSQSLDAAILGGYVAHVLKEHPGKPLPDVYLDDQLIADARDDRARRGDDAFIAQLPAGDDEAAEWGMASWDAGSLDEALSQPPGGQQRRRLVGDLLAGPYKRYARTVRADQESFIPLDEGLSVISKHAREVLGYDAIVLLLDELVLWLAGYIGDHVKVSQEAQKVSKLIESAEHERPAPIISFVPRQRDLRDLVSKAAVGNEVTGLFDTLKYWDGRFEHIPLTDNNLPEIAHQRLLKPKDEAARQAVDEAFTKSTSVSAQTWDILLDSHGEKGDRDAFRLTYPFSPAFVHAMVDISSALQRERTALKLMQQLLVDYRDILPVGQLMPLGAIFDVLAHGADRPFTDKLRDEFETARGFYNSQVRPYLLGKYHLTEEQAAGGAAPKAFRADDLVVKTLLLAALVPNVPALSSLTATRLAALNHGSIVTMLPNQERAQVARTLNGLSGQFGQIRLSGNDADPRVDLALIGVDTEGIIRDSRHADDPGARRRLVRDILWGELDLKDEGTFEPQAKITWKGTERLVDVVMGNVCDPERMPVSKFQANPGAIRMIIDYPFDEDNRYPADDALRVNEIKNLLGDTDTLVWLPHFLSEDRIADLSNLIVINHLLERNRLAEATPNLTTEDRYRARTELESRRNALTNRLREALRRAYGVNSPNDDDLGPRAPEAVMTLARDLTPGLPVGQGIKGAFSYLIFQLLDHRYPRHPDFDPNGKGAAVRQAELEVVLNAVEQAKQDPVGRFGEPGKDIATLKKIANPLKLGVMHESAFVLNRDWPDLLDRKAAGAGQVSVAQLRSWIDAEQPGLPVIVQNLVIAAYAIQADKAWLRADKPYPTPRLDQVPGDMTLRSQELPTPEEFALASARAAGIFGIARQPVRSVRSVQVLAEAIRRNATGRLGPARQLAEALAEHAGTLGLDSGQPRLATSDVITMTLARLDATTDPTETVRVLASADLRKENAFYQAHLRSAETVTTALGTKNWPILDEFAASADDAEAAAIISMLREAARHDEQETALADPLRRANDAAVALVVQRAKNPGPADTPTLRPPVPPPAGGGPRPLVTLPGTDQEQPPAGTEPASPLPPPARLKARDVAAYVLKIADAAEAENPDTEFEISWRVVTD
jgi:hypothetical protein